MEEINFLSEKNLGSLLHHSTILFGETNTKKTLFTAKFLKFLLEEKKIPPKKITILDFAPKLKHIEDLKIGGKIQDYYKYTHNCRINTHEKEIIPPRLNSENKKELCQYALHNYILTQSDLEFFQKKPTKFLLINDISIYLHLGNKKYFLESINKAETFFGNTYYGESIGEKRKEFSLFNLKERKDTEHLIKRMDFSFHLT